MKKRTCCMFHLFSGQITGSHIRPYIGYKKVRLSCTPDIFCLLVSVKKNILFWCLYKLPAALRSNATKLKKINPCAPKADWRDNWRRRPALCSRYF